MPYIEAKNASATFEHEATTSKISDDPALLLLEPRVSAEEPLALIVNGFVRDVLERPHGVHGRDAKADWHFAGRLGRLTDATDKSRRQEKRKS